MLPLTPFKMNLFDQTSEFSDRHIGPGETEVKEMLKTIGADSLDALINKVIPAGILATDEVHLPAAETEAGYLEEIKKTASLNKVFKSYIGQGYYNTIVPSVVLRNLFENPGWYTSYTPYQAEIAQGRLESLLNFQTVVADLTGLPIANASLLDEGTAAAEAMSMFFNHKNRGQADVAHHRFFVDENVFETTKNVLQTRAGSIGIELVFGNYSTFKPDDSFFGALLQYPDSKGNINNYQTFISSAATLNIRVALATDLMALVLLKSPGALGADVAIGSSQRFGVPMGFGGPHAAFFATKEEFKRNIPGRIIGVSIDADGKEALRMALQTREQHIRREKATSNICTAQALLANMAAMYAVYHGPRGLKQIAKRIAVLTCYLKSKLEKSGFVVYNYSCFDTITVKVDAPEAMKIEAEKQQINFYYRKSGEISISLDETTTQKDVLNIINLLTFSQSESASASSIGDEVCIPELLRRNTEFMTHPVFNSYHSETEMMRYMKRLENKDLSLVHSMISLGSCTMKLNAASEMLPVSMPEFAEIHPLAPHDQVIGYTKIISELEQMLASITGFTACSVQPNSGAQGEFTGLLAIKKYHEAQGNHHRDVILIPISAHGTNPASAVMAGCKVVVTKCLENGDIDVIDLKAKAEQYKETLAGIMVTYPSTHGVFEESIKEICRIVHDNGGLVYMDGANMNAQAGYTSPGGIGADICHLNLHKTFAIPHGGGGPGVGPVCANDKLKPFLPPKEGYGQVSSASFGSANVLLVSYAYLKMLGITGLKKATAMAILNANYMKERLSKHYQILFTGPNNTCAHEFIVDLRPFKASAGIEAEDIAKRLMDYGFHAPTLSFPVHGTIMVEPTESESKPELDRFCDALIAIYHEIKEIEEGKYDKSDNVLKNAPHTLSMISADEWKHKYPRSKAAYPLSWLHENKFWPAVRRVNNTYGDRNLVCTCAPVEAYV